MDDDFFNVVLFQRLRPGTDARFIVAVRMRVHVDNGEFGGRRLVFLELEHGDGVVILQLEQVHRVLVLGDDGFVAGAYGKEQQAGRD